MHFRVESVEGLLCFLSAGTRLALEKTLPTPMDGRTIELALYVLRSKWKWPQESRIHSFSSSLAPVFSVNLRIVGSSCTELCSDSCSIVHMSVCFLFYFLICPLVSKTSLETGPLCKVCNPPNRAPGSPAAPLRSIQHCRESLALPEEICETVDYEVPDETEGGWYEAQ